MACLLCCNHDALYDKGFIAFDGQGRLHISSAIAPSDYLQYQLVQGSKIRLYERNKPYFKWHKSNVFH